MPFNADRQGGEVERVLTGEPIPDTASTSANTPAEVEAGASAALAAGDAARERRATRFDQLRAELAAEQD